MSRDESVAAQGQESMADFFTRTRCEKHRSLKRLGHYKWWPPHKRKVCPTCGKDLT